MQSARPLAILLLIAPLPAVAPAQGSSGLQIFASQDNTFPGGQGMAGFGLSIGSGGLAARGSFALDPSSLSASSPSGRSQRWAGDLDLVVADNFVGLGQLMGGLLHPYGFLGLGASSRSSSPTIADAVKTWSYGGGISVPLGPSLGVIAEMRQRTAIDPAMVQSSDFTRGTELRLGFDFRLGSARGTAAPMRRAPAGIPASAGGSAMENARAAGAARRVIPRGERYLGVPYVWGGSTPKGFDCSGFVQYIYRQEGVELPRTSRQMAGSGFAVGRNTLAVGDLLLFADGGPISHVAIYAGNNQIIHSSSSGNGVRYDDLGSERGRWFAENIVAIRRVASGNGAMIAALARSFIPFDGYDPPDGAPVIRRR